MTTGEKGKLFKIITGLFATFSLVSNHCYAISLDDSYNYLTPSEAKKVKGMAYATERSLDNGKIKSLIDFEVDCGIQGSTNLIDYKPGNRTFLVEDASTLKERLKGYPEVLDALGRSDGFTSYKLSLMQHDYEKVISILNGSLSPLARAHAAAPFLNEAEAASKAISTHAKFNMIGGCGAGPEDSETIVFKITPKPTTAYYIVQMDFDHCKSVLSDPFDTARCEAWTHFASDQEDLASGQYTYQVTWTNGKRSIGTFNALGTSKKTVPISQ